MHTRATTKSIEPIKAVPTMFWSHTLTPSTCYRVWRLCISDSCENPATRNLIKRLTNIFRLQSSDNGSGIVIRLLEWCLWAIFSGGHGKKGFAVSTAIVGGRHCIQPTRLSIRGVSTNILKHRCHHAGYLMIAENIRWMFMWIDRDKRVCNAFWSRL